MLYAIYYERELPKETPIPISIGFLDLERTGSFRCGGNHLSADADFSMSNSQLNHSTNFNCSVNDLDSVYAYQCGMRCYSATGDFSYNFIGVKFSIYGTKDDGNHEFDVELDGTIIATINEYQTAREAYTEVYQSGILVYKEHTVRIIHKTAQYEIYKLTYWPSVNAIRMNSTSFVKVGSWVNESDGVGGLREYTNTAGNTFSTNFTSSKFWIIGSFASHLEGFKLTVNQVESDVSETATKRKDSTIVYQSTETSHDYTLISGRSKGVNVISCIFYQNRPSPIEYIDKTFTKTLPYFQILVKKSMIKQISGCSFINIEEDFDYFITLEQEVLFNDDLFRYDDQGSNRPAPINIRYNGKLTLRNCTFENSRSRNNNGGNVFYCGAEFSIEVYFISCNFQNCGNSKDLAIINIQNSNSKISISKCDFVFDNTDVSSMVIKSNCAEAYIEDSQFTKTCGISIKRSTISDPSRLSITNSSFDYCGTDTMNFLDLSLGQPSSVVFESINISNMVRNGGRKFTIYLTADNNIQEIKLKSISFTDNKCCSLFGGGVGVCIEKVNTLSFYDCTFIRNKAGSDGSGRNEMLNEIDPNYRAGDGGGIQLGFLRNLKESAIKFEQCVFKDNKAIRHGGALAIQTTSTVEIIGCSFESNEANSNIDSSNLLWENHFDKKTQGRGGAIYINPSFSYTSSSSDFSMTSLTISSCTFSKNLATDGYAIYIEGDDPGTTFGFENNNFNNNFNIDPDNDPNITVRGVIATEIHSIVKKDVLDNNHFLNDELSSIPKEFVYVDHYGNIMPTHGFTESQHFTKSNPFSQSNKFTNSGHFTLSNDFSSTKQFSSSYGFSESLAFTPSASLIPNPLCSIIDEFGNMTLSDRCEYEGSEDHKVTVEITRSNFTDFHENQDGGAIRVNNCEVECNGTLFANCSSASGGGGGIFINNTINIEINIHLINLTFIQCHAVFGGAVFIRSVDQSSQVLVLNCFFDSNRASGRKNIDVFYGGSALFLATSGSNVTNTKFLHSKGEGGAVRVDDYNCGLNKRIKGLDDENMKTISITDCIFEEDDDSTNSILDTTANEGKEIELINCIFKGKSANEKSYINSEIKHRFHIVSCSFDNNTNAIRNYVKVDVEKPVYEHHKQVKRNSYISIIASFVISISILVLTLVKIMKSIDIDNIYESYDQH